MEQKGGQEALQNSSFNKTKIIVFMHTKEIVIECENGKKGGSRTVRAAT